MVANKPNLGFHSNGSKVWTGMISQVCHIIKTSTPSKSNSFLIEHKELREETTKQEEQKRLHIRCAILRSFRRIWRLLFRSWKRYVQILSTKITEILIFYNKIRNPTTWYLGYYLDTFIFLITLCILESGT